jgi:tetratricopeptide (TPR) repeat protein
MVRTMWLAAVALVVVAPPGRGEEKLDKGKAKVEALMKKEKWDDAVRAIDALLADIAGDKTIRFDEEIAPFHAARGTCHQNLKKHKEAVADYKKAAAMDPKNPWPASNAAWLLATSPDDNVRNGKDAVKLALEANKRWEKYEPNPAEFFAAPNVLFDMLFLQPHVLAAAYAEAGQFKDAVRTLKELNDVFTENPFTGQGLGTLFENGDKEIKLRIQRTSERLEMYRNGKPLRIEK